MNLNHDWHPDEDGTQEVSSHTLILGGVFLLSGSNMQRAVGEHPNPAVPGNSLPLPGPCDSRTGLSGCLAVQCDFVTGINDSFNRLKSDNRSTLQSQAHAALRHASVIRGHTRIVTGIFLDSAVDGQGAVAQLPDPVVGFKLHALPVPLDGWGRVSSHLTIQDSITSKWLDPIRRVLTFEDGRFLHVNKPDGLHKAHAVLGRARVSPRVRFGHTLHKELTVPPGTVEVGWDNIVIEGPCQLGQWDASCCTAQSELLAFI